MVYTLYLIRWRWTHNLRDTNAVLTRTIWKQNKKPSWLYRTHTFLFFLVLLFGLYIHIYVISALHCGAKAAATVGTADISPENFLQGKTVSIFRHFGFSCAPFQNGMVSARAKERIHVWLGGVYVCWSGERDTTWKTNTQMRKMECEIERKIETERESAKYYVKTPIHIHKRARFTHTTVRWKNENVREILHLLPKIVQFFIPLPFQFSSIRSDTLTCVCGQCEVDWKMCVDFLD